MAAESSGSEFVYKYSLDNVYESTSIGSLARPVANTLYGINIRQTPNALPAVRTHHGFTFFVRPQLNMDIGNISNHRPFYSLLNSNPQSYQRFTRLLLDPRLASLSGKNGLKCPFLDNHSPFMAVLTNTITKLSGWPSPVVPTYTSERGAYGEVVSYADGHMNHYEEYDVTATFNNFRGNYLIYLFWIWTNYSCLVAEDILRGYTDLVIEKEIDYTSCIYRLTLDHTKRYVEGIARTGYCFPLGVDLGNLFDFDSSAPFNLTSNEISIRFRCVGFKAMDDHIKYTFNLSVGMFNAGLNKLLNNDILGNNNDDTLRNNPNKVYANVAGCGMVKIPPSAGFSAEGTSVGNAFYRANYRAIPYINLATSELEFWVPEQVFASFMAQANQRDTTETPN